MSNALVAHMDPGVIRSDYPTRAEKTAALVAEVEKGVAALTTTAAWRAFLDFNRRFHSYSVNNQFLIMLQRSDATRVAGFRTWLKHGRCVRKGEKGITILRPLIKKTATDSTNALDDCAQPVRELVGFSTTTVFDISQTTGEPLPADPAVLTATAPPGLQPDLERIISEHGYTVEYLDIARRGDGWTHPATKTVAVKATLATDTQTTVLAHELGHIAAGHCDPGQLAEYTAHRDSMECVAESIAYVLCKAHGMDPGTATFAYVAHWVGDNIDTIRATAEQVRAVSHRLLTEHTWTTQPRIGAGTEVA